MFQAFGAEGILTRQISAVGRTKIDHLDSIVDAPTVDSANSTLLALVWHLPRGQSQVEPVPSAHVFVASLDRVRFSLSGLARGARSLLVPWSEQGFCLAF